MTDSNTNLPPVDGNNQQDANPLVDKILKEKKNAMERVRTLEQELENYKSTMSKIEEDKLLEQKKFQEIAEKRKQEADQWKTKFDESQKMIVDSIKTGAIKTELLKLGIDPKYSGDAIKLIDLNKIHYDNETRVVIGAEDEAKVLLEKFPPLFGTKPPGVSHAAPSGNSVNITLEDWKKLPYEERKKRENDLYNSMGIKRTR